MTIWRLNHFKSAFCSCVYAISTELRAWRHFLLLVEWVFCSFAWLIFWSHLTYLILRSLLGPLLFIIYVNDLPTRVKLCYAFGYADDFKFVSTQPVDIRTDLEAIENWCEVNKMKLNENKCYFLPVKQQQNSKYHFQLNSKFIESKFEQKDLGVIISARLSSETYRFQQTLEQNLMLLWGMSYQ